VLLFFQVLHIYTKFNMSRKPLDVLSKRRKRQKLNALLEANQESSSSGDEPFHNIGINNS